MSVLPLFCRLRVWSARPSVPVGWGAQGVGHLARKVSECCLLWLFSDGHPVRFSSNSLSADSRRPLPHGQEALWRGWAALYGGRPLRLLGCGGRSAPQGAQVCPVAGCRLSVRADRSAAPGGAVGWLLATLSRLVEMSGFVYRLVCQSGRPFRLQKSAVNLAPGRKKRF